MSRFTNNIWVARVTLFLFGILFLLSGLREVLFGDLHYSNYWGGAVFAPLAIAIGLFLLVMLVLKWRTLDQPEEQRKLTGKAARKARQAEETKFPIDDFKKW